MHAEIEAMQYNNTLWHSLKMPKNSAQEITDIETTRSSGIVWLKTQLPRQAKY
jgi:hypothetical protein